MAEGEGVGEGQRDSSANEEEGGKEEADEARMLQGENGGSGGGFSGAEGGRGGPWGLGWMREKGRGRHWRRDNQNLEEEGEENEDGQGEAEREGGREEGRGEEEEEDKEEEFLEVKVSAAALGGAADGDVDREAALAPPGGDVDVSVEQRLGEALLARASDR